MIVLGITGPTGAGKSTVSKLLEKNGIKVIDTDLLARKIVEPGKAALIEIIERFGKGVILANGELDRRALAKTVFSDPCALIDLNKITHKYIAEETEGQIAEYSGDIIGIDGAALIESGINKRCHKVLSVMADPETRKKRIMERDLLTEEEAERRIAAQKNNEFYIENSDYLVYNNDIESLIQEINKIINELRSMI